ncbi:DNA ligase D [Sphingobium indicum]|uniref:DNA ligase (ATP) n=2 Tax=Sphingobium indicum TaxID=332055 RepID=A0A1L5BNB0_SPHIB|nr:DNA ligase D [Sphingobium indicum]APL94420.1 ATP-dependent DNA ligase [Sphingobium indicum B90A]KEY98140.1 ATP-dependent DNA ligase [Sphingomonas sp. BHC-A]NYI24506.1 bifunctional non-homologous end joining protein LigD [Sphingobium indicum]RYM04160.1 DNA ligase D [Sphingobium indicum]
MADADPLTAYNRKRDFSRTREPAGRRGRRQGNGFIVQKHDATRLHYDFRLEMDGVLKSWAVTRGPSIDPADKRLAVRTEDHPLSYATFEGTIPKGEYGGGTVMLWDEGTWEPVPGKSASDLEKGHLHFILHGQRMRGEWLLIRLKPRGREKRENWLLRKIEDAHAGSADDLIARNLTSIRSGRTMAEIAAGAPAISLKGKKGKAFDAAMAQADRAVPAKRRARAGSDRPPPFQPPQLATLVDAVPTGNGWMHEIKYDGYRCLVSASGGKVRIFTRSGLDWTDRFAPLAAEIAAMNLPGALIDGEVVALGSDGNPDFSTLQQLLKGEGKAALHLFAFDLLQLDGQDLTAMPNIGRKEKLAALLGEGAAHIHVGDHVVGAGERLFQAMCGAGQEGIISKRADAPYRGARTKNWLKVKCTRRQEFVIVGWTPSGASGRSIRNLLLGQREGEGLVYAGKVGTGFNAANSAGLVAALGKRGRKTAALSVPRSESRGAQWVRPDLVAEIAFAEFTAENIVRHASFLGLREDKAAREVRREEAMPTSEAQSSIRISNPDRLIFPEAKITKGELAEYYARMGAAMLPWIARRPISLVRCPQGRAKKCFFQKHDSGSFGDHVKHVPIREKEGNEEDYLYIEDSDGLLACVQMGAIEFHGWGSGVADVERPDRMIFDLDPDEGLDFEDVKKAARDIRRALEDMGLASFAMLSGGKGIHVVVPLTPQAQWPEVKDFADRFARALAAQEPDRFTATMSKAKRKGRIFIDWLRNQRGATAVLPYVVRARELASVAAPVTWEELDGIESAAHFTVKDAALLLDRASSRDLRGWGEAHQPLPAH